jgi:hypothetical protein
VVNRDSLHSNFIYKCGSPTAPVIIVVNVAVHLAYFRTVDNVAPGQSYFSAVVNVAPM